MRNQQSLLLVVVLFGVGACITNSEVGKFYPPSDDGKQGGGGVGPPAGYGFDGGGGDIGTPDSGVDSGPTIKKDPAPLMPAAARVAAGAFSTCAIDYAGKVICWGDNTYGQLGVGSSSIGMTRDPQPVQGLDIGIDAVFGGSFAHCALKKDSTVVCWGDSDYHPAPQGQPMHAAVSYAPKSTPKLPAVASVAIGTYFQCALTLDKDAKCYGQNSAGQLGNKTHDDSAAPVDVAGLGGPVRAIAASQAGYFACAITSEGALKCWGANAHGQLGNGTTTDASEASTVTGLDSGVTAVAAGSDHACAVAAGDVLCWGNNASGQLGDGTTSSHLSPKPVSGPSHIVALTAGTGHTCALSNVGALYCWGNYNGNSGSSTPVQLTDQGVIQITAGSQHTCMLLDSNVLYCWGLDDHGQLGPYYNRGQGYPL